ncbi:MAG: C_GCAxxG_C_C family protein [Spirochaetales bacterium]|nr:C_GCAxxG_C_C family protein [Spirochaetales bacterium]
MTDVYIQRVHALRAKKYNCAQAVACTFSEEVGLEEELLFRIMAGFGGGMGGHEATCGALSGAVSIISMLSSGTSVDPEVKALTYQRVASLVKRFKEKAQSLVCREILGEDDGKVLLGCEECIDEAVILVAEFLTELKT